MADYQTRLTSRRFAQGAAFTLVALALGYIGYYHLWQRGAAIHTFPGEIQMGMDVPMGFNPASVNKPHLGVGGVLSLAVSLDSSQLTPIPGSVIKGKVRLLKNGFPIGTLPESMWAQTDEADSPSPRVYLRTFGVLGMTCSDQYTGVEFGDAGYTDSFQGEFNCPPSQYYLPLSNDPAPSAYSKIYSPQAKSYINPVKSSSPIDRYLDFSTGEANFEITYQGGRNYPSLVLDAYTDPRFTLHQRINIPFADQLGANFIQPDLNGHSGDGAMEYKLETAPATLEVGKPQLVKVTVSTPRDLVTDYRRVRLEVSPWGHLAKDSRLTGRPDRYPVDWQTVMPGSFLNDNNAEIVAPSLASAQLEAVATTKEKHNALLSSESGVAGQDLAYQTEVDLIDGEAVAYFWYNGEVNLNDGIGLIVEPADFDYEGSSFASTLNSNLATRYAEDLPSGKTTTNNLLYGDWVTATDPLWRAFAEAKISFTNFPGSPDNQGRGWWLLIWLWIALHAGQLLLGGGLLMALKLRLRAHPEEKRSLSLKPTWAMQLKRGAASFLAVILGTGIGYYGIANLLAEFSSPAPQTNARLNNQKLDFVQPASESGWKIAVDFDGDYISSFPGQVNNGIVRILDKNGNQVLANGALAVGITNDPNASAAGSACLTGVEETQNKPETATWGKLTNTFGFASSLSTTTKTTTTDELGQLLDESGLLGGANTIDHDLVDYSTEVSGPGHTAVYPKFNYASVGNCSPTLITIQDGVGHFGYETAYAGTRFVAFRVSGYESASTRAGISEADKWPTYPTTPSKSIGGSSLYPGNPPTYSICCDSLADLVAQGGLYTTKSFEVKDMPATGIAINTNVSALPFYFRLTAPSKIYYGPGKKFDIHLLPQNWNNSRKMGSTLTRMNLAIVALDETKPASPYYGADKSKTYPAYFVTPGSGELTPELSIDTTPAAVTATIQLSDNVPPNYVLKIIATGTGLDGLPYYFTSNEVAKSLTESPNATVFQKGKDLPDPTVMELAAFIPIGSLTWNRVAVLAWLPLVWLVGILFLLYNVVRRKRHERDSTTHLQPSAS